MESTILNGNVGGAHSEAGEVAVVAIDGRLDALEAGPLRQMLKEHLEIGKIRLVVDLSRASFIDSAGLAALVWAMKHARSDDGDLRLVAPKAAEAMRVFELTRFDKVFEIRPSLDETLADW